MNTKHQIILRLIAWLYLIFASNAQAVINSHPVTPSLVNIADNSWVQVEQGSVTAAANIMSYSGGWYDPQNHQYCIFGGGHWDYSGNEVWCLDIATLSWQQMYAPDVLTTQNGDQGAYNNYDNVLYPGALFKPAGEPIADANPMSRHTYDQMEFVEGLGPVVWGGYFWGDGVTTNWCEMCKDTWAFNFNTTNWQYLYNGSNPSPNRTAGVGASAYSKTSKLLYALVIGETWTFNPVNSQWSLITTTGNAPYSIEMTMEYDSKRNVLYTFGGTYPDNPSLYRFDIATSNWTQLSPTGSGPGVNTVRGPGVAYDEANDVLLVYKNGNVWTYNPNNNSWTQNNPVGGPPVDDWDAYGRFRYDPINKGAWYHGMQNGQHTTWFYRYSNDGTPPTPSSPPTVSFVANPMSIEIGAQTSLSWASDATACLASGDWSNAIDVNGSLTLTLLRGSTFILTCTLNGVSTNISIRVETVPASNDSDNDGLLDSWEQQYFGNLNSNASMDNDNDGLINSEEFNYSTNPVLADTDGDGVNDGDEVVAGSDPLLAQVPIPNTDKSIVSVTINNLANTSQTNLPVTYGHVFKPGDVPEFSTLRAQLSDNTPLELQVDKKATHADGSLRHAVITAIIPNINAGASQTLQLLPRNTMLSTPSISIEQLLQTSFDATVTLMISGVAYQASARDLLTNTTVKSWLSGALVSEWLVNGLVTRIDGVTHPHLTARFAIRAYENLDRVRVSISVENTNVLVANAGEFVYDVSINIDGQGEMLQQSNVPHYRQGRWRRVFWWGERTQVHIEHDKKYFEATRAIPSYDPNVSVPDFRLDDWLALFNQNNALMEFGLIDPYMPGGGAREHGDIAPLPGWTATWIISQDVRAKTYMLGTDTQAATYNIHFRDENTGYPIRASDHTDWQAYVSDDSGNYYPPGLSAGFPSGAVAEPSHEPDFAYVPYLITGDYFFLEEMQFWASWNIMYGSERNGASGYVVWDQVRGQAWSLRSIAHAAYATPDEHALKTYYLDILNNNRLLLENKWLNTQSTEFRWPSIGVNPLGYVTNEDWLGYTNIISTWMDDFLTWSVGHISELGFTRWNAFRDYKVAFPVGRTVANDSCWVLAPSYWPDILDTYTGGLNTGNPVTGWQQWKETIVYSSNIGSLVNAYGQDIILNGVEREFLATTCGSTQMYSYLNGLSEGEAIGYSLPDSYIANLQAALAVAVNANYPNAQQAFDRIQAVTNLPDYSGDGRPAWALVPYSGGVTTPPVPPPPLPVEKPTITLNANPLSVEMNGSTLLSWSVSNSDSCTASNAWSGNQLNTGSREFTTLTSDVTYTLSCTGTGGKSTLSVTVSVLPDSNNGGTDAGAAEGVEVDVVAEEENAGSGSLNIMFLLYLLLLFVTRRQIT